LFSKEGHSNTVEGHKHKSKNFVKFESICFRLYSNTLVKSKYFDENVSAVKGTIIELHIGNLIFSHLTPFKIFFVILLLQRCMRFDFCRTW